MQKQPHTTKPVPISNPLQKNNKELAQKSNTSSKPIESSGYKTGNTDNLDEFAKYLETLDIDELKKILSSLEKQLSDLTTNSKATIRAETESLLNRTINHVKWYIERWIIHHPPPKPQKTTVSRTRDSTNKTVTVKEIEKLFSKLQQQTSKSQTTKRYQPSKNFKVELYGHQKVGVEWMISQEASTLKGGILADDMGLGKTIQVLSLLDYDLMIQAQQSQDKENLSKKTKSTTLVVCPLPLLQQWNTEITRKFVKGSISVLVYHGKHRASKTKELNTDVVLTTYETLASEFKKKEISILYQKAFYRIILDEAQLISNYKTQRFQAVQALQSTHRWALSGTPIQNGLEDLIAFLIFLKFEPWNVPKKFITTVIKGGVNGLKILESILPCLILRRTKSTISLPPASVMLHSLEFSPAEKTLYDVIFTQYRSQFSQIAKDTATTPVNFSQLLTAHLRLLQVCTHPQLLENAAKTNPSIQNAFKDFQNQVEKQKKDVKKVVDNVKETKTVVKETSEDDLVASLDKMKITANNNNNANNQGIPSKTKPQEDSKKKIQSRALTDESSDSEEEEQEINKEFSSDEEDMKESSQDDDLVTDLKNLNLQERKASPVLLSKEDQCTLCYGVMENAVSLPCCKAHYCRECLLDYATDSEFEAPVCKSCGEPIATSSLNNLASTDSPTNRTIEFLPSKVAFLISELERIALEDKTTKSIVYSQWTTMLSLLESCLDSAGIKYSRMDGSMNSAKKGEAIARFKEDPEITVLLLSLKAGGVGLNLTEATHVFMMDLWWNPTVEQQAFDRVHRIGQTKPVFIHRMWIKNSFEQRVLERQEKKKQLAQNVLHTSKDQVFMLTMKDFKDFFQVQ